MQNKRIISVFIILVFLAAVAIGGSAVFTVAEVKATYTVISGSSSVDITATDAKLSGFEGKNILFLKEKEIRSALSSFTYVKIDSVKKSYPNYLEVSLSERRELLAGKGSDDKYYMLDAEGFVVCVKDLNQNNVDGNRNILIEASCSYSVGGLADDSGDALFKTALGYVGYLDTGIKQQNQSDGVRNAVSKIAVKNGINIEITMREGLIIRITDAGIKPNEKLESAFDAYILLSPEEKMAYNAKLITVALAGSGEISTAYSTNSQ